MAAEYLPADVPGLHRLAVLVDALWREPTPSLATEIRLTAATYGLSPADRRRLAWAVGGEPEEEEPEESEEPPPPTPRGEDPRLVLRVVK